MLIWSRSALLIALIPMSSDRGLAGDRELGQYLSSECTTCHQLSGRIVVGVPQIIGWPEDQFIAVMAAYRTKQRDNAVMQSIAGRLSNEDIAALATFFGSQKPTPTSN